MEHYLSGRPVADVPWKGPVAAIDAAAVRQAAGAGEGATVARVYVSARSFRERYPAAMARTVLGRLFSTLDLGSADASLFTARAQGRELVLFSGSVERGVVAVTPWTVSLPADAPLLKALPREATAYLVIRVDWPSFYTRVMALCDAILTDPTDEPTEAVVARHARRQGIEVRRDILERMQPLVLVHDHPQHPLRLPLMVTALAAAQTGAEEKVKSALALLTADTAATLEEKERPAVGEGKTEVAGQFTRLRLRTDPDGTSYLQFGLVGPAWGWVQNRLVFSWSPGAVRLNRGSAGQVTSSAFAAPGR
jgi:hypothetical protein